MLEGQKFLKEQKVYIKKKKSMMIGYFLKSINYTSHFKTLENKKLIGSSFFIAGIRYKRLMNSFI